MVNVNAVAGTSKAAKAKVISHPVNISSKKLNANFNNSGILTPHLSTVSKQNIPNDFLRTVRSFVMSWSIAPHP